MKQRYFYILFIFSLSFSAWSQDLNKEMEKMVESFKGMSEEMFKGFDKSIGNLDFNQIQKNFDQIGRNLGNSFGIEGINIQKKRFTKNNKHYLEFHITPEGNKSNLDISLKKDSYSIKGTIIKEEKNKNGSYSRSSTYSTTRSLPEAMIGRPNLKKNGRTSIISMQIDPEKDQPEMANVGEVFKQMRKQMNEVFSDEKSIKQIPDNENSNGVFKMKKLKERQI